MNWIKHVVDFKNRFLENFFGQSSIHGFPYVVKKETHFIEKLFWIVTILLSVYATFYAFSNQWKRYNENPTVLSIGFLKPSKLNRPAITICAPFYTNETEVVEIIGNIWGVDNSSVSYEIYDNFLHTMSELNYKNMGNLKPFLEHSDKIYNNVINNQTIDLSVISYMLKNSSAIAQPEYNHVITELGLCQSTTKYNSLQNPFYKDSTSYGEKNLTAKNSTSYCVTSEVCQMVITPNRKEIIYKVLVHNIEDVVVGDSQDFEESDEDMAIKRTIRVDLIVAEDNVIELKPKSRKCLFRSEPNSEYFNVYTKDLCKIDCRIKRSLMFCKCVPFFYAIPNVETCDIKGMICLSESQWYNTSSCECPNLCEEVIYTRISTEKDNTGPSFSGVTIFLQFSKTRIIRSVLFNFNDLLVGLGGCVSFFLGFSFLTGVELFYSTFECVIEFIINIFQSRKRNISSY